MGRCRRSAAGQRLEYETARCPVSGSEGENDKQNDSRLAASWIRQYTLVFEFLGALGLLGYGGYRLDQRYGWEPWGLLVGLLTGMGVGLYLMMREGQWRD